jgi:hypothetical protein
MKMWALKQRIRSQLQALVDYERELEEFRQQTHCPLPEDQQRYLSGMYVRLGGDILQLHLSGETGWGEVP